MREPSEINTDNGGTTDDNEKISAVICNADGHV